MEYKVFEMKKRGRETQDSLELHRPNIVQESGSEGELKEIWIGVIRNKHNY
jgi:hypothetical protein